MAKRILAILYIIFTVLICSAKTYSISDAGMSFIMKHESCSLERYWDNGAYSIGYGHRMPAGTHQYVKITMQVAKQLLRADVRNAEQTANDIISKLKWTPSQPFFDGLVSVIYNCGCGGIRSTEFYNRLMRCRVKNGVVNQQDLNYTVAAIKTARIPSGKYAKGVKARRYEEHRMMLN